MKNKLIALVITAIFLSSCSMMKMGSNSLKNTEWKLTEFPNNTIPEKGEATLKFGADALASGKSFCNNYGSNYVVKGDSITFSKGYSTMMHCSTLSESENKYMNAFNRVNKMKMVDGKLHLMNNDEVLLVYTKTQ